jgi:hypothetical protein
MFRTKTNFKNQLLSCILALIIAGIISTTSASGYTITSFPPSSFNVTDRTTPAFSGATGALRSIIGYKDTAIAPGIYRYKLTDTVPNMTVSMFWKDSKIDLFEKEFKMSFRVSFGTGANILNPGIPAQDNARRISDGIA